MSERHSRPFTWPLVVPLRTLRASLKLLFFFPFSQPHLFPASVPLLLLFLRPDAWPLLSTDWHNVPILEGSTPASPPPGGLPPAHQKVEYPLFFSPSCALSPVILPVRYSLTEAPRRQGPRPLFQAGTTSSFSVPSAEVISLGLGTRRGT